jgi:predicted lipoprotein with Yx(FWY)xxD motif
MSHVIRLRCVAATIALIEDIGASMIGSRRTAFITSLLAIASALAVAACGGTGRATTGSATGTISVARSAAVHVRNTGLGEILVDAQGRTLYLFKADSRGASACEGACAAAWPPLLAHGGSSVAGGANASLISTIQRPTGALQLTYNGHPLYLYVADHKPGDVNGEGVTAFGAPWYVLSPAGNQVTSSSSSVTGTATSSPVASGY